MKITREGSSLELQVTEDAKVVLYCLNKALAEALGAALHQRVVGMDVQITLNSGLILDFDDRQGLVLETKE